MPIHKKISKAPVSTTEIKDTVIPKTGQQFSFADNRLETTMQLQLQEMANAHNSENEFRQIGNNISNRDVLQKKPHLSKTNNQISEDIIQAIINSDTFRTQTPGSLFKPRKTVDAIDTALDNYHLAVQGNKLAQLGNLLTAINIYRASKATDPTNPRLTAVNNLRTAALLERPLVIRLDTLAAHGVTADLTNIGAAAAMSDLELTNLATLGQINTIQQLVQLHNQARPDAHIIALAALPQVNSFASLNQLVATARPQNEISQLADLGGVGLGGHVLPAQPTFIELLHLTNAVKTIVNYTTMLGEVIIGSVAELEEYARTGRINRLIDELHASQAHHDMYYIPMNLAYSLPVTQLDRTGWKAAYGSVYAISSAAGKLDIAARSAQIQARLVAHNMIPAGAAVPDFLVHPLKAAWLQKHTGAEGVHYQGGDRGDDQLAN